MCLISCKDTKAQMYQDDFCPIRVDSIWWSIEVMLITLHCIVCCSVISPSCQWKLHKVLSCKKHFQEPKLIWKDVNYNLFQAKILNIAVKLKVFYDAPVRSGCMWAWRCVVGECQSTTTNLKYAHMDAPQIQPTVLPLLNIRGQRETIMNSDILFRGEDGSGVPNKRQCERLMAAAACEFIKWEKKN